MKAMANGSGDGYGRSKLSLIWLEFKKLFMPKRVGFAVLVLLLGGLWLYPFRVLYPSTEFKDWDNEIAIQMAEKYGFEIDASEFEHFKQSLIPKIGEADAYIRSTPAFARVDLDSYERYAKRNHMTNGGTLPLNRIIDNGPAKDLFAELQASLSWIEYQENAVVNTFSMNEIEKQRVAEIQSRDWISVLPLNFINTYYSSNLLNRLALSAMLITALFVMPIQIGDRRAGLGEIQATSKAGINGLFRAKMVSALWVGTLTAIVMLFALLLAYRFSGVWSLMGASINGRMGGFFWYELSFLQYVLVTYVAVLLLCWITALFTIFFSSIAANYIVLSGLLGITLILFFESDYLLNPILGNMLQVGLGHSPFRTLIDLGILLAVSIGLTYIAWKREKERIRW